MQVLPGVHLVVLVRGERADLDDPADTDAVLLHEAFVHRDLVGRAEVRERAVQHVDRGVERLGRDDKAVDTVVEGHLVVVVHEREIGLLVGTQDMRERRDSGSGDAPVRRVDERRVRDRLPVVAIDDRRRPSRARDECDRGAADERDEHRDDNQCAPPLPELRSRDEAHRTEHVRR